MKKYNKLVRDNIPEMIQKEGKQCSYRILNDNEFVTALKFKLKEEVFEFLESDNIEELADVFEVLATILEVKKITRNDFKTVIDGKRTARGGFKKKILLIEADE